MRVVFYGEKPGDLQLQEIKQLFDTFNIHILYFDDNDKLTNL